MNKIFLVEDDINFGSVLCAYLDVNEFNVTWIKDGKLAIQAFKEGDFDICILDVMLPNIDGFSIAKSIRIINSEIPFIFLTAKALKEDILKGFKLGADDYITKPFDSEILILKINAILQRNKNKPNINTLLPVFKIAEFEFDFNSRLITDEKQKFKLSPKEADLLKLLFESKDKVLDRETALLKIWGDDNYFNGRSMDVFITKLRKYFKSNPNIKIENIHGKGFKFFEDE